MTAAVALLEVGSGEGAAVRAARVAAIASQHADAVDAEGRFPREAVDAMRAEKLLSIQIPADLGGEGASVTEIAELCSILGQACAASAMVFAMHQIKLSSWSSTASTAIGTATSCAASPGNSCCSLRRRPKAGLVAICATASAPSRSKAIPAPSKGCDRHFLRRPCRRHPDYLAQPCRGGVFRSGADLLP